MKNIAVALTLATTLVITPLYADDAPPANSYLSAKSAYDDETPAQRISLGVVLVTLGCTYAAPDVTFTKVVYDAIVKCQTENGLERNDGVVTADISNKLFSLAAPKLREWGFRTFYHDEHLIDGAWMPMGLNVNVRQVSANETTVVSNDINLETKTVHLSRINVHDVFQMALGAVKGDQKIQYRAVGRDYFILNIVRKAGVGEGKELLHMMYRQRGVDCVGVISIFPLGDVDGARITVLMDSSFNALHDKTQWVNAPSQADLADK